jgi:hypothetical protein
VQFWGEKINWRRISIGISQENKPIGRIRSKWRDALRIYVEASPACNRGLLFLYKYQVNYISENVYFVTSR